MEISDINSECIAIRKDRMQINEVVKMETETLGDNRIWIQGKDGIVKIQDNTEWNIYYRLIDLLKPGDVIIDDKDHKFMVDSIEQDEFDESYVKTIFSGVNDEYYLRPKNIKGVITKEQLNNEIYELADFKSDKSYQNTSKVLPDGREVKVGMIAVFCTREFISQVTNINADHVYAKMQSNGYEYILNNDCENYNLYNKPFEFLEKGDMVLTNWNDIYEITEFENQVDGTPVIVSDSPPDHTFVEGIKGVYIYEEDIKGIISKEMIADRLFILSNEKEREINQQGSSR